MAENGSNAVAALAQELGWPGSPAGDEAEALGHLLDDEFERLGTAGRRTFAEQLKVKCPDALGPVVLVCPHCNHVCLRRYLAGSGRCRVCNQ
jgi:hypothetical protein